MIRRTLASATILALAGLGCAREGTVRTRAAFDLNCPEDKLEVVTLSSFDATFGARGCGKRATYLWRSNGGAILNSPIQSDSPAAPAAPSTKP